jgi:hypothetical protein
LPNKFQARTEAKLKYAQIHLEEISSRAEANAGDEFERAHVESFLFHIVGAKDSFLQEINHAHNLGLPMQGVDERSLRRELESRGRACPALARLQELQSDKDSWLSVAIEIRNQAGHRFHIPRKFYMGGERNGQVYLGNPRRQTETDKPVLDFLADCLLKTKQLLQEVRPMLPVAE